MTASNVSGRRVLVATDGDGGDVFKAVAVDNLENEPPPTSVIQVCQNWLCNPTNALIAVIWVGAFLTFYPLWTCAASSLENSALRSSLESRHFRDSSYATLSVSLVFATDVLIDHLSNAFSKHAYRRYTKHKEIVVDSETLMFTVGAVVVPMIALLPTNNGLPLALIYVCASQAQLVLLCGFVGIMCCRYYTADFSVRMTVMFIALFCGSSVIRPYAINASYGVLTPFRNALYWIHVPGMFIYLYCSLRWVYTNLLVPWRRQRGGQVSAHFSLNKYAECFSMTYALSAIVCTLFIAANSGSQVDFYETSPIALLQYNVPVMFFQAIILLIRSQFSK